MPGRIIKDIRYYESESTDKTYPAEMGHLFEATAATKFIGQRIARKLHEFEFTYQEYDHIYISFSADVKEHDVLLSDRNVDPRIKYIDFGLNHGPLIHLAMPGKMM